MIPNDLLHAPDSRADVIERELTEFSYIVSHDLAAPCRHLSHFSQLLLRDMGGNLTDSQRTYGNQIQAAGEKCQAMLEQLILTGVDVCRLNMAHADHAWTRTMIRRVRDAGRVRNDLPCGPHRNTHRANFVGMLVVLPDAEQHHVSIANVRRACRMLGRTLRPAAPPTECCRTRWPPRGRRRHRAAKPSVVSGWGQIPRVLGVDAAHKTLVSNRPGELVATGHSALRQRPKAKIRRRVKHRDLPAREAVGRGQDRFPPHVRGALEVPAGGRRRRRSSLFAS